MGQQPRTLIIMNPNTSARSPGYHQKAMEEIQNSLRPFAKSGSEAMSSSAASTISSFSATSGVSSLSSTSGGGGNVNDKDVIQLRQLGYSEESSIRALQITNGRVDIALDYLTKQSIDPSMGQKTTSPSYTKLIRKQSIERELGLPRGSPALDSGAGSSRSDSPRLIADLHSRYSPSFNEPPPPPPPRNTPPPPPPHVGGGAGAYQAPPVPSNVQQMFKRMSPAPVVPARTQTVGQGYNSPALQQRGTSPVSSVSTSSGRQPMVVQNGPQVQQQLSQQMQALSLYQSSTASTSEPPPPYPLISSSPANGPPPPPSYSASIQNRQSPTQDFRKSPSSGIYSGSTSAGSPSPIPVSTSAASTAISRPTPLQAWGARQTISQPPIIMQSVKSTQVQKPVLQTAIAPTSPQLPSPTSTTPPAVSAPPPSYTVSIQQKGYNGTKPAIALPAASPSNTAPPVTVPTTEPPSYASTMQAKAKAQRGMGAHPPLPPPPYSSDDNHVQVYTVDSSMSPRASPHVHASLQRKYSPVVNNECRSDSPQSTSSGDSRNHYSDNGAPPLPPTASSSVKNNSNNNHIVNGNSEPKANDTPPQLPPYTKIKHQSPIPERKKISKEKEEERRDGKVKNYSPQAFKFFMEQHIENVIKSYKQRQFRRMQLEKEMNKIGLSSEAQTQMRKMLSQKESNYIRLKRAKMDKSMFVRIKPIGVGAFGEVTLVRKIDTNHLYAMKTLRKSEVLKRNQVAHVKAERDILAEADNEWVVKLYYSFQDSDILYFVMDYIPGGDLMALLIKLGIFEEVLARFYIAELTCAVESVHKMGFIHRDIKPDNILIDKDGHIKLTDFGLCTGFRWTHNSKYYQPNGDHSRQDSMDPIDDWNEECNCKPLERRRRREHRCLAHSLVGTPNYIAPEVLQRKGYTHVCDWWSVGVILYEMLVGQPPFLANTPAETQYKVINWETTLQIPKQANLSAESTDLILKLCCSAEKRLGKNASEVKSHPFFKDIDFEKGLRRQQAPYKPRIEYPTDTSNFDPIDPDKLRNSTSIDSNNSDELVDNSNYFHGFFEFTFRRFFDDGGLTSFNKINLDDNDNQGGPVYV
ncbi:serine/threonine-protein kinase Warts [Diabrotica virgifera virgifera]|uniref:non-specific serine/threonine protein kinase n=1 Tax=Diabrotica virgifera virgifera TaxID=50390 RepID=A0A6P7FQ66_DIAVI|nr:serine/threonine-protein kinase Warts [Diabrotica virgifera virgifera]